MPFETKIFAQQIFQSLKSMDAEAVPLSDGTPTGLNGYRAYVNGFYKKGRGTSWENSWTKRLAELLPRFNYLTQNQVRYGETRKTCDLVLSGNDACIWLEAKGAWPAIWNDSRNSWVRNGRYSAHLARSEEDVNKLLEFPNNGATHLALLLVGFEHSSMPIASKHLSGIRNSANEWVEFSDSWPDHWYPQEFVVRTWIWITPAKTN